MQGEFWGLFQGKRNISYEAGSAIAVSGLLKSIFLRIKMFTSLTAVISCNFALLYIKKVRNVLLLQWLHSLKFNNCVVFQIHWFSIFNSFMMVIFLVGLVSMILMRTLRKDYARYSKDEELDDMVFGNTSVYLSCVTSGQESQFCTMEPQ